MAALRSVVNALRANADRLISTTIAMLAVLIVFDGWQTLGFWQIVAGILGILWRSSYRISSALNSVAASLWAAG